MLNKQINKKIKPGKRLLVVTAVAAERDAVLRGLGGAEGIDVIAAGVGAAAAAAAAARRLTAGDYGLVVSAGIGGGFAHAAEVGSIAVADSIIAADLGAETPEGFCSLDELGFGSARIPVDADLASKITAALQSAGLRVCKGPVLTVTTVTGTAETALQLARRVPGAVAEAMEGYGVAAAARECQLPVLEIRAVSNVVGPRDRDAWRIKEALAALETASSILSEVLL